VDQAEVLVEGDALLLRLPKAAPRAGWDESARQVAAAGDDSLTMPEFANDEDAELVW